MNYEKYEVRVYTDGDKYWYKEGKLHRTDGPAIEYASGTKQWYQEGKLHRTDGPAVEYANGDKFWWKEGKRHRTDGPAVEYANGTKLWYIEGKEYTEKEFNELLKNDCDEKTVEIDGKKYKLILQ